MGPPDRLSVPTCIGCGAMSHLGTCDTGCSEHKLELVRAAAYDALLAAASDTGASAEAFADVAQKLARQEPAPDDFEGAYRSAQGAARDALRLHPDDQQTIDSEQAAEYATTWWCAECGGIDAPQPCLGICVWRPVEWVRRSLYEQLRERTMSEREREQHLRELLHRAARITPRPGHWEHGWRLLQTEARQLLDAPAIVT
jgi:hypothetical protein